MPHAKRAHPLRPTAVAKTRRPQAITLATVGVLAASCCATGCYASHAPRGEVVLDASIDASPVVCPPDAPTCLTRDTPCGLARVVAPACNTATGSWRCPAGAWERYPIVTPPTSACLPFLDDDGPFVAIEGSLPRIPLPDGRCLWVAETARTRANVDVRNVGFVPDLRAPYGTCPSSRALVGEATESIVTVDGAFDPSLLVQLTGGFLRDGVTRVTYRLFRLDSMSDFGVTELGTGLGRWDPASRRIIVSPPERLEFGTDFDFGDALLQASPYVYLWGCPPPIRFLTEGCVLARLDPRDRVELFAGGDRWIAVPPADAAAGIRTFDAGPWISSVTARATGELTHVYAEAFTQRLQAHTGFAVEGPWTRTEGTQPCDLPDADGEAFCAGPVVHEELWDPAQSRVLPVTYAIGTLRTDAAELHRDHPRDYASRLVFSGAL